MRELMPDFPRHLGFPERVTINTPDELCTTIKKYNGIRRIFYSLYCVTNPIIDKIFFDFDSANSHTNVLKLRDFAKSHDYKRMYVFSGNGFHSYIWANPNEKLDQKSSLKATQEAIAKELGLTIGDPHVADIDRAVVGDIARIVTLPGTLNTKRKRWATCIDESKLDDLDWIKKYTETQHTDIIIQGSKLLELIPGSSNGHSLLPMETNTQIHIDDENLEKTCPPCVLSMMLEKGDWKSRYYVTVYLKEIGFGPQQIDEIAKKYFSKFPRTDKYRNNYEHFKRNRICEGVFKHADEYMFPNCRTLIADGFCTGKCAYHPIEKKLYK